MATKLNSKKSRLILLAAAPVALSLWTPNSVYSATFTWSGDHSNFIGTTGATASASNWASPFTTAAGVGNLSSNTNTSSNTDLAVLPDSLPQPGGGNSGWIYIATTSNQNLAYSLGAFELVDASPENTTPYNITNNNTNAVTITLYLNGTTVNGVANTILANTTTSTQTVLDVGTGLGSKAATAAPLALGLGNTTNNIYSATGDQVIIGSSISESTAGSSLSVSGGGTLALTGTNTFSGGVTANSSTLVAGYTGGASTSSSSTGTSASTVTLNSSTLASASGGVTSYVAGNVSLASGSNIIAPGGNGATNNIGTLDLGGSVALSGSTTIDLDLSGGSADQLNLSSMSITGTPTVNIDNANGPSGNFVVATYPTTAGLSNSSFNFTNTPSGYAWDVTSMEIELIQQQPPANVTWHVTSVSGSVSGTWDTATGNWVGGSPVADLYKSGDTANFNDISGGTSGLISIVSGGVTPFNTNINNTNTSYSFTDSDGINGISGAGALTKSGTGTATLESPNSYGGNTTLNGGVLIADGNATLGGPASQLVFAGGTLEAGAAIGSTGSPSGRVITVNTGGGTFNTNGFSSVNNATVNVNDIFNVTGSGGLELDGPVTFAANGALDIGTGATVTFGGAATSDTITQINPSTYNGKLVVTNTARINFNTGSSDSSTSVFNGSGEIDIANGGTTQSVTIPATTSNPAVTYTTYDTGVTITNLKSTPGVSTAGGIIEVPIHLNSTGESFTKADVTQPDATFVPGNFTVTIGGTTAGDGITIDSVISGNSDVNIANGPSGGGAGSLTLGAQNTYTGTTLINGSGTLQLAVADALPTTTDVIFATINSGVGSTTTIDLDGNVQQWNSLSAGQWRSQGDENITNNSNNPATLEINGSTTPADPFDGVISDGNGFTSLDKEGTGTLHLTGTSTFSGGTTLNAGAIIGANDFNLGSPFGALSFGGGTLDVIGSNPYQSIRPITVNPGGGTIDVLSTQSYTLSSSAITWNGGTLNFTDTGTAMITQSGGTISVAAGSKLSVAAGANLTVNGSTDPFTDNTGSEAPPLHVAVVNNGSLTVNGGLNSTIAGITGTGALTVGDGVTTNTLALAANGVPSSVGSLSIMGNSALDITNNKLIVDYGSGPDPIASIAAWIHNGFYDLSGPQIFSSEIAADDAASGLSYGIGYADGADGEVAGLPSGEIEIMYTLLGDANLDGTVNSEDFTPFSHNLGQNGGWDQGDFNYDGTINAEDFTPFSHNLGQTAVLASQASALESADGISLTNVPEPASLGLLTLGAVSLLARRRRRRGS
jgi:autotransporter-associated beta strand protein